MKIFDDRDLSLKVDHFKKYREQIEYKNHLKEQFIVINFTLLDQNSKPIGGISGWKHFDFSFIEVIWVDKNYRRQGLGCKLVSKFEKRSIELLCLCVLISVIEIINEQKFWLKQGYTEKSRFENIPESSSIIYMFKSLKS